MELLREIYERDLGISGRDDSSRRHGARVWLKRIVRGVIYNVRQEIALLHIEDGDYYELPGGELEAVDSMGNALQRGVRGALGLTVAIIEEIGLIMEYRDEHELLQFSYGFLAELADVLPESMDSEQPQLRWMKLQEAIALLSSHRADSYIGKFNQERDLNFLMQFHHKGADE